MRKISFIFAALALSSCSNATPMTPEEASLKPDTRASVENIAQAFTKGDKAFSQDVALCMGNVVYGSNISDEGTQALAGWDGKMAPGLSKEDEVLFNSPSFGQEMAKCIK